VVAGVPGVPVALGTLGIASTVPGTMVKANTTIVPPALRPSVPAGLAPKLPPAPAPNQLASAVSTQPGSHASAVQMLNALGAIVGGLTPQCLASAQAASAHATAAKAELAPKHAPVPPRAQTPVTAVPAVSLAGAPGGLGTPGTPGTPGAPGAPGALGPRGAPPPQSKPLSTPPAHGSRPAMPGPVPAGVPPNGSSPAVKGGSGPPPGQNQAQGRPDPGVPSRPPLPDTSRQQGDSRASAKDAPNKMPHGHMPGGPHGQHYGPGPPFYGPMPGYGMPPVPYWPPPPGCYGPPVMPGYGGPPPPQGAYSGQAPPWMVPPGYGPPPTSGYGSPPAMPSAGTAGAPATSTPSASSGGPLPPAVVRRNLSDGVDGLVAEIKRVAQTWSASNTTRTGHVCLEALDVCGVGLDDAGATKLFESLTRLQVGSRRVMLAGNSLTDAAMGALSNYLWHSPEPLWELNLSENRFTARGVEELLRCLYNHPSHPPHLPSGQSPAGGAGFALRLDLRGNFIVDSEGMASRVESQGGANSVKLVVVAGDGPAPPPMENPHQPLPYLWVFLPRLGEQQQTEKDGGGGRSDKQERHERRERKEKRDRAEKKERTEKREKGDRKERKEKSDRKDKEKLSFEAPQQNVVTSVATEKPDNETGRSRKEEKTRKGKSGEHRQRNGRQRRKSTSGTRSRSRSKSRSCSRSRSRG